MMACVDRIRMFLQNIHNHVCNRTHGVLNQTTLRILKTVSPSNPVPKIIKTWNVDGKVTLGKLNYRTAVYIVTKYLMSHTFPTHCEHCYILCVNTVIYCVWTLLYIACEHCYILRLNTLIYCVWTLLYIAFEHCYILRLNTVIYCIWILLYIVWTLLYVASEHCYLLRLNTVIYCVWTLLYIVPEHCYILGLNTVLYIMSQKTEETNHFQYKYTF